MSIKSGSSRHSSQGGLPAGGGPALVKAPLAVRPDPPQKRPTYEQAGVHKTIEHGTWLVGRSDDRQRANVLTLSEEYAMNEIRHSDGRIEKVASRSTIDKWVYRSTRSAS